MKRKRYVALREGIFRDIPKIKIIDTENKIVFLLACILIADISWLHINALFMLFVL